MKLECWFCKEEITEKGALIFSPPYRPPNAIPTGEIDVVNKFHVCGLCFIEMIVDFKPTKRKEEK